MDSLNSEFIAIYNKLAENERSVDGQYEQIHCDMENQANYDINPKSKEKSRDYPKRSYRDEIEDSQRNYENQLYYQFTNKSNLINDTSEYSPNRKIPKFEDVKEKFQILYNQTNDNNFPQQPYHHQDNRRTLDTFNSDVYQLKRTASVRDRIAEINKQGTSRGNTFSSQSSRKPIEKLNPEITSKFL